MPVSHSGNFPHRA